MLEQSCFCGAISYQLFINVDGVESLLSQNSYIEALGLIEDNDNALARYVRKSTKNQFEHGYCRHCGYPIYQINNAGVTRYFVHSIQKSSLPRFQGAMQFGL